MIVMSLLMWASAWIFVTCLNMAAARQVRSITRSQLFAALQVFRIRSQFLRSVLNQDISWYDTNTATDFASRMTE